MDTGGDALAGILKQAFGLLAPVVERGWIAKLFWKIGNMASMTSGRTGVVAA
jgi:hypothetical protein